MKKTLNPNFFIYVAVRRPLVETLEKPPSKQLRETTKWGLLLKPAMYQKHNPSGAATAPFFCFN
ncbi:MAG: hypothetical protein IPN33_13995 [Saprospiraceae bacterium]|nr:hypothetical protein [Saprospiraceae bacterium]